MRFLGVGWEEWAIILTRFEEGSHDESHHNVCEKFHRFSTFTSIPMQGIIAIDQLAHVFASFKEDGQADNAHRILLLLRQDWFNARSSYAILDDLRLRVKASTWFFQNLILLLVF